MTPPLCCIGCVCVRRSHDRPTTPPASNEHHAQSRCNSIIIAHLLNLCSQCVYGCFYGVIIIGITASPFSLCGYEYKNYENITKHNNNPMEAQTQIMYSIVTWEVPG